MERRLGCSSRTVLDLFAAEVRRRADAIAMEFGDERLTYREVALASDLACRRLVRRGVGPETSCGIPRQTFPGSDHRPSRNPQGGRSLRSSGSLQSGGTAGIHAGRLRFLRSRRAAISRGPVHRDGVPASVLGGSGQPGRERRSHIASRPLSIPTALPTSCTPPVQLADPKESGYRTGRSCVW